MEEEIVPTRFRKKRSSAKKGINEADIEEMKIGLISNSENIEKFQDLLIDCQKNNQEDTNNLELKIR